MSTTVSEADNPDTLSALPLHIFFKIRHLTLPAVADEQGVCGKKRVRRRTCHPNHNTKEPDAGLANKRLYWKIEPNRALSQALLNASLRSDLFLRFV